MQLVLGLVKALGLLGSQGRHPKGSIPPSWVLRDEYEFAGLEWGKGTPGRGTRGCGRHGHGIFREQWGLLAGGGVRKPLGCEGGRKEVEAGAVGWGQMITLAMTTKRE